MLGLEPLPFNRGGINILALTESPREIDEFGWYENVDFPCPKCKNPMMLIGGIGCWD